MILLTRLHPVFRFLGFSRCYFNGFSTFIPCKNENLMEANLNRGLEDSVISQVTLTVE